MYLTAQRVRRIKGERAEVGVNAFLYQHEEHDLPDDLKDDKNVVDRVANQNQGTLVAESVDLVPGGNSVLSFVDVVGREGVNKERIRDFLDQNEPDVDEFTITRSAPDLAVRFGITYGLQGQEVREYRALMERAIHVLESPEPPRWRSQAPWMEICRESRDNQSRFSLSAETSNRLKKIHGATWASARVSVDRQTTENFEFIHSDLIQHIAPMLTGMSLEQIAAHGGLIISDISIGKKLKWPELKEI
ncbi:MAG: hypothetical protein J4F39_01305 [Candidatus Latescibacteria bacterium]|nr:hypothetical protein [Candidatus Latescibacterota bacterium]